jgi:hypothetical protein
MGVSIYHVMLVVIMMDFALASVKLILRPWRRAETRETCLLVCEALGVRAQDGRKEELNVRLR